MSKAPRQSHERIEARPWNVELPLTPSADCRHQVDRLSGLLHDAWIARHGSDLAAGAEFRVAMERIGYEFGRSKPVAGVIPRVIQPRVSCVLEVCGVRSIDVETDERAIWDEDEDQLLRLELLSDSFTLWFGRDFGDTWLDLRNDPVLRLEDTGQKPKKREMHDLFGGPFLPEKSIELLRLHGPLGPWDADLQ